MSWFPHKVNGNELEKNTCLTRVGDVKEQVLANDINTSKLLVVRNAPEWVMGPVSASVSWDTLAKALLLEP
jgi:hypothetical protein